MSVAADGIEGSSSTVTEASFPSIEIALEQARFLFDLEAQRSEKIEGKAGLLLGAGGGLLTAYLFAEDVAIWLRAVLTLITITSIIAAALVTRLKPYAIPSHKVLYDCARLEAPRAQDVLLLAFRKAIEDNEKTNNQKLIYLKVSLYAILTTLSLIAVSLVGAAISVVL